MERERLALWLGLHHLGGVPLSVKHRLLEHFSDIISIFDPGPAEVPVHLGVAADVLYSAPASKKVRQALQWLETEQHHLISWEDSAYPPLLREITDPPLVLYVHGSPAFLAQSQLAIVGSRNPTPQGEQNAYAFAKALVRQGLTITSGCALGIDAAAHRGAIEAGGATIALVATGVNDVYPPAHAALMGMIARNGAVVSEFPLDTPPRRTHFPQRNRLIAGLSLGVLIVEAAEKSGALITARYAADYGREVFAVPGSIHAPQARGCHALIKQGAKLVEGIDDIMEEISLNIPVSKDVCYRQVRSGAPSMKEPLSQTESELLEAMGFEPITPDRIAESSGLTIEAISSMLLPLELTGRIKACPGGRYQRIVVDGYSD